MYYVYILTNSKNTVLYIGITNNIIRRIYEHKNKMIQGFTSTYNINKLIYYEEYKNINDALRREKQLKGWNRNKKENLVNKINPEWNEMYELINY